jgi:hypothetical protein
MRWEDFVSIRNFYRLLELGTFSIMIIINGLQIASLEAFLPLKSCGSGGANP